MESNLGTNCHMGGKKINLLSRKNKLSSKKIRYHWFSGLRNKMSPADGGLLFSHKV